MSDKRRTRAKPTSASTVPVDAEMRFDEADVYGYPGLETTCCGLTFANPFVLAASPCTDDLDMVARAFEMGWAGAVLKTTSIEGTRVDLAYPMITSLDRGTDRLVAMGNIDLISHHHIDVVEKRIRTLKRRFPDRIVIGSMMGASREEWQSLARRLSRAGADMIECSFSCPQGSMGADAGKMVAQSIELTETVASWVKEGAGDTPVAIKITPQVTDIVQVARALERAGVDAITASNSVPALMGVDLDTFVPYPSLGDKSTYSGLTGPAIKPITLRTLAEIARHVPLPILGTGGASDWRDAVEFMLLGAGVVQYCTAPMHHGFRIIDDLTSGLSHYLAEKKLDSPTALIGKALPHIVDHDGLPRHQVRSRVVQKACIGCGLCVVACRDGGHQAIAWSADTRLPEVDDDACVGCGLCLTVRPVKDCMELVVVDETGRGKAARGSKSRGARVSGGAY
jgi:dihydropyrimidine dehydrogenase (NAD+) subunit PreA